MKDYNIHIETNIEWIREALKSKASSAWGQGEMWYEDEYKEYYLLHNFSPNHINDKSWLIIALTETVNQIKAGLI